MKTLNLLFLSTAFALGAAGSLSAQSATDTAKAKDLRQDRRDVRRDTRDLRADHRDVVGDKRDRKSTRLNSSHSS